MTKPIGDWRTPVAEAVVTSYETILRTVKKGQERCYPECGERGSCHPNLNAEARMLAIYVKTLVEAKA